MKYYKVIQQNYGTTWEDVSLYPCNSKFEPIENQEFSIKEVLKQAY